MKQLDLGRWRANPVVWIAVLTIILLGGFVLFSGKGTRAVKRVTHSILQSQLTGGPAPAFTLTDLDGKAVSLSDFRGKVIVLDFWATWCPPCKREIPDFISLQKDYASKGLQIVGIALDKQDKVVDFAKQNGINYPVLLGDNAITESYGGIDGIPTTFVIDKTGTIRSRFEGFRSREVFEAEIKKLL